MAGQEAQPESRRQWDGLVRREIAIELRSIDIESRSVEVVASSEALDAHGDVVKQFWNLKRYKKNGPILWNHNIFESSAYTMGGAVRPEDLFPIGKGTNVRVEENELIALITFGSKDYSALADKAFLGFKEGILKAVSVGFRPGSVKRVTKGDRSYYEIGDAENPNELMEISVVPMGSNPEAVAKAYSFVREELGRIAAKNAINGEELNQMAMTPEEQLAFNAALTAKSAAESGMALAVEKVKTLETELTTLRSTNVTLSTNLETANKSLTNKTALLAKSTLDALQGVKFAPAEREEYEGLVKDLGVERVQKMLEKRETLPVTQPVTIDGKALPAGAPAPAPVAGSNNGSADLASEATKGI